MLIDFNTLWPKYDIKPKGVLHIGSSKGQETEHYIRLGVKDIVYIEALPNVFKDLVSHVKKFNGNFTCINACISGTDGVEVIFNVANNEGQSSSMLEFGTHSKEHPGVNIIEKIRVKTSRVDTLYKSYNLDCRFDFLNIDLQGAELIALKSMGFVLADFHWAYIEVNKKQLYKGCPLVEEIDEFMKSWSFIGVEEKYTQHGWGDKLYKRI